MLLSLIRVGWGRANPAFRHVFSELFVPGGTRAAGVVRRARTDNHVARDGGTPRAGWYQIEVTALLAKVTVPTLVAHGRDDAMIPFAEGRAARHEHSRRPLPPAGEREPHPARRGAGIACFLAGVREFLGSERAPDGEISELSPREIEVLELVATGLSNEEIAERLYLSVRTVERHLTNIYAKLRLSGKAARAAACPFLRVSALARRPDYVDPATQRRRDWVVPPMSGLALPPRLGRSDCRLEKGVVTDGRPANRHDRDPTGSRRRAGAGFGRSSSIPRACSTPLACLRGAGSCARPSRWPPAQRSPIHSLPPRGWSSFCGLKQPLGQTDQALRTGARIVLQGGEQTRGQGDRGDVEQHVDAGECRSAGCRQVLGDQPSALPSSRPRPRCRRSRGRRRSGTPRRKGWHTRAGNRRVTPARAPSRSVRPRATRPTAPQATTSRSLRDEGTRAAALDHPAADREAPR